VELIEARHKGMERYATVDDDAAASLAKFLRAGPERPQLVGTIGADIARRDGIVSEPRHCEAAEALLRDELTAAEKNLADAEQREASRIVERHAELRREAEASDRNWSVSIISSCGHHDKRRGILSTAGGLLRRSSRRVKRQQQKMVIGRTDKRGTRRAAHTWTPDTDPRDTSGDFGPAMKRLWALLLRFWVPALLPVLIIRLATPVVAAVIEAGPGKPFARPSTAIARAKDGDVVRIAPGIYEDCAIVRQNRLTIEGIGGGETNFSGRVCDDKAILVIAGTDVTVRGITLSDAKSSFANGAGIRAEGARLTVDTVKFIDNQNGILGANDPRISIRVTGSTFIGNGSCRPDCAHGIYMGHGDRLRVESSKFFRTNEAHHIKSRAQVTEIVGCTISDGPLGTASFLIDIPNGGTVLIEKNQMIKGPRATNHTAAIEIGEEGETNPPGPIIIRDNRFVNLMGGPTAFVRNGGMRPALLTGNEVTGPVEPLAGEGEVR
jgi:hypothetical protein